MKDDMLMNKPARKPAHWLDVPANHRKLWIGFWIVLAATVAAQWWWPVHGHFTVEALFGFNALYGFCVCALMIAVAKLAAHWLKRPDTYYDDTHD